VRLKDEAPDTQVIWLLRGDTPEKAFGGGVSDKLAARGELGAAFAQLVKGGRIAVEAGLRGEAICPWTGSLRIGAGGTACCGPRSWWTSWSLRRASGRTCHFCGAAHRTRCGA
jgi:hypothetical protein